MLRKFIKSGKVFSYRSIAFAIDSHRLVRCREDDPNLEPLTSTGHGRLHDRAMQARQMVT